MHVSIEPDVSACSMDDAGLVLLSERTGRLHRCNPTAAAMWTALLDHDGHSEPAAVAVAQRFGTDLARVRADLGALLTSLSRAGLVMVGQ
ncbi:PqqD family peptide modification chaperone [Amycolatopsis rhizosphaerae]|nr:PqqD family peptide modification chaperone [Amycolatopsis rhizosphaerae]